SVDSIVPNIDRLARRGLVRPVRDHFGGVLLRQESHVRRTRELERDRLFAVVAQPIAHSRGEALVRDPYVLADAEPGHARQRARRRLEDEAHGAGFALWCELVVVDVQDEGLGVIDAGAVLYERASRYVL